VITGVWQMWIMWIIISLTRMAKGIQPLKNRKKNYENPAGILE